MALLTMAYLQVPLQDGVQLAKGAHLHSKYSRSKYSHSKYNHSKCSHTVSTAIGKYSHSKYGHSKYSNWQVLVQPQ